MHRLRIRALLLGSALLLAAAAHAQAQRTHLLQSDAPVEHHVAKRAQEALLALDARARCSVEGRYLKAKVDAAYTEQQVLQALSGSGAAFEPVPQGTLRSAHGLPLAAAHADGPAYDQAKRQWIAAHPEAYQRLLSGEDAPLDKAP